MDTIIRHLVVLSLSLLVGFCALSARSEERPDVSCSSLDVVKDYECMKANWRPRKQVSYDTAEEYCDRGVDHLYGKGYVTFYVDDKLYHRDINCPGVQK